MNENNPPQNSAEAWMSIIAERANCARFQVSDLWPDRVVIRISGDSDSETYTHSTHHFTVTLEEAATLSWLLDCAVMAADKMHGEGGEA